MNMFEQADLLLDIVHKCASAGTKLNALGAAAMAELLAMNEHCRQEALAKKPAPEPTPDEEPEPVAIGIDENGEPLRPASYPADSQTATIADRRL